MVEHKLFHQKTQRAVILDAENRTAVVKDNIPIPKTQVGEVLVQIHAVALNPVDALYVHHPLGATGRIVGSDFAGVIVPHTLEDGENGKHQVQRVAGFLQGACSMNPRPGAFCEYVAIPPDLLWTVPAGMTLEEASTISLCGLTAAQALYWRLGLPAPFDHPRSKYFANIEQGEADAPWFLIYGASTSLGLYIAQFVRRSAEASGRRIKLIGTASPARFSMLQAEPYCYDALISYRDPEWSGKAFEQATGGMKAKWAADCISEGDTVRKGANCLMPNSKMVAVRSRQGGAWSEENLREDVEVMYGAVWEGLGHEIKYQNMVVPADPKARDFAVQFYKWLSAGGKLAPNPTRVMPGGLGRIVPDGFALLGSDTMGDRAKGRTEEWMKPISAEKLVYQVGPAEKRQARAS